MQLEITPHRTVLYNKNGYFDLGSTECSLGNVIECLENEFPSEQYSAEWFIITFENARTNGKAKKIYGMREYGQALFFFNQYNKGRDKISLSLKDVEKLRLENNITTTYIPKNHTDINAGFVFEIKNIIELLYSLLYYYAFYEYKLVRCEHCGRWFVTDSFKNKYCPRNSTYEGYSHLHCKQAVDNIMQEIRRRKKNRRSVLENYKGTYQNDELDAFLQKFNEFNDKLKQRKSIENLQACINWLETMKRR